MLNIKGLGLLVSDKKISKFLPIGCLCKNNLSVKRTRSTQGHTFFKLYRALVPNASHPLRKHAYSNILKILQSKTEHFQIKNSDIFHIFAPNIDCGYSLEPPRRGGSNEYPQSMFTSRTRKIMYTPVNPSFTI